MIKRCLIVCMIGLISVVAVADEKRTYKDEIPMIMTKLGISNQISVSGYKVNKKEDSYLVSESKTKETITVETDTSDLNKFEYYLKSDGYVINKFTYANGKIYKSDILVEAVNEKTEYRYPSYVRSIERQSDFYKHDLMEYLKDNGWTTNGLLENEYQKDNYLLKISHSSDYAIIVEITTKELITELNKLRLDNDSYDESDDYIKSVYTDIMAIE